jgi:HupE / UreJ protein
MKRLLILLATALALAAPPARAHQASDAYITWQVADTRVDQRVDLSLIDLDRALDLDADGDAQLTWGEVRSRWADLEALVDSGVQLAADGGPPCAVVSRGTPQLESHGQVQHAVLTRTLQCAAPVRQLRVDYRLFATTDATHRGLAQARQAGAPTDAAPTTAVLTPGRSATLDLGQPRPGFLGFVAEGMHHIAIGLDHILFLVTLLMVAVWRREGRDWSPREGAGAAWRETLRLVTAFTVSHSLTLGLAAAGVLAPPARVVETLIAASVLLAALDNLRPFVPGPRWIMVSLFGLAHGFGFAGPLQELGLARGELALPLLGFNLGVELGQLAIVALLLPLACLWRATPLYRLAVVRGGSAAVALLALGWTLQRALDLPLPL